MGLPFTCMPASIDETPQPGLNPRQVAEDLAIKKVMAVAKKLKSSHSSLLIPHSSFIFGADTIVVFNNKIYGKPEDRGEAGTMLRMLAGKKHEVITAMAIHNRQNNKTDCRSVSCDVEFAPLTEAEIQWYLDTGEWQGVAGAYQLQNLGGCLIKSINGSPSAVAGLPLHDFYVMLRDNGCRFGA